MKQEFYYIFNLIYFQSNKFVIQGYETREERKSTSEGVSAIQAARPVLVFAKKNLSLRGNHFYTHTIDETKHNEGDLIRKGLEETLEKYLRKFNFAGKLKPQKYFHIRQIQQILKLHFVHI